MKRIAIFSHLSEVGLLPFAVYDATIQLIAALLKDILLFIKVSCEKPTFVELKLGLLRQ